SALAHRKILDRLSIQCVRSFAWAIQQAENRKQRGFSAARRPRDRNVLTALDFEIHTRKRMRLDFVGKKYLFQSFKMYDVIHHCCYSLSTTRCFFLSNVKCPVSNVE